MLYQCLFNSTSNVFNLDFLQNTEDAEIYFVAPSPLLTDTFRQKIKESCDFSSRVDVITISKFLDNTSHHFFDEELLNKRVRKVDLLQNLAVAWKSQFDKPDYELFSRAFNLFTDIRSFTLDPVITDTVLESYDPEIAKGVKVFNALIDSQNFIDEHKNYFLLSEFLREGVEIPEEKKIYVFFGFGFFAGSQIDFFKALSIRNEVYIPMAKEVYENSFQTDWVRWFDDARNEVIEIDESVKVKKELDIIRFSKNRLNEKISQNNELFKDNSLVYLATKNASLEEFFELPIEKKNFKVSVDLFEEELSILYQYCVDNLFIKEKINISQAMEKIKDFLVARTNKEHAFKKSKNFKTIKLLSLCFQFLTKWSSSSEINEEFSLFDLKVLHEVLSLNCPRNNALSTSDEGCTLMDISGLDLAKEEDQIILVAKANYSGIKSSRPNYSDQVEKILSPIGPIRRNEFDFLVTQFKIKEIFNFSNTKLIIENDLEKHDLSWNQLLESYELNLQIQNENLEQNKVANYDFLFKQGSYTHTVLSASRLQTYIDCPKKFSLRYVEKLFSNIEWEESFQLNKLGELEHKVIEVYFEHSQVFEPELHIKIATKVFNSYLAQTQIKLTAIEYSSFLAEVISLSSNGAQFISQLKEDLAGLEINFEVDLKDQVSNKKREGRLDCFGVNDNDLLLIDFKRSSGSIPNQAQMHRHDKIQVWFYLNLLLDLKLWKEGQDFMIGYFNLSKKDGSLIITNSEQKKEYLAGLPYLEGSRVVLYDDKWSESFGDYRAYEDELFEKMITRTDFSPSPNTTTSCSFCPIYNICPKGEQVNHGAS